MGLFKVYCKAYMPVIVEGHVDIPSDEFVESMAIERIEKHSKHWTHYQTNPDCSLPTKEIKIVLANPVNTKVLRLEYKNAKELENLIKAEKKAEKASDKKAESKMTLKEKKDKK